MDINKEKEAFEDAINVEHENASQWLKTWNASIKDYKNLYASYGWRMWQKAIKSVQSKFVLLPSDTAQEVLAWAKEAKWNSMDSGTDLKIKKHLTVVKRAIKAQEQAND